MLAIYGFYSEKNGKKNIKKNPAISNHFVTLKKVCYWEEKICKQRVQPPKSLFPNGFVVHYPILNYSGVHYADSHLQRYTISAPYITSQKYTKVHTMLTKNEWKSNFLAI